MGNRARLEEIREQAANWLIQLDDLPPNDEGETKAALAKWLATSSQHRKIFGQMQHIWDAPKSTSQSSARRWKTNLLSIAAICVALITLVGANLNNADYETRKGEFARIELPDGSTAHLDSDSAIAVEFSSDYRRVKVLRGEVLVIVNGNRTTAPFTVETPNARATALGTQYSVSWRNAATEITVYESSVALVALASESKMAQRVILSPGQRARIVGERIEQLAVTTSRAPDWLSQRLVFNNETLGRVVGRLAHYRKGWLILRSNELKNRRFTGVLPTNNIDESIDLIAKTMGLRVTRVTPFMTYLSADPNLSQTY